MEGDSSCHLFTKDCRDLSTKSTSPGWKLTPLEDNPKPKAAIQELDVKVIRSLCEVYNYVSFVSHFFFVKCPLARMNINKDVYSRHVFFILHNYSTMVGDGVLLRVRW